MWYYSKTTSEYWWTLNSSNFPKFCASLTQLPPIPDPTWPRVGSSYQRISCKRRRAIFWQTNAQKPPRILALGFTKSFSSTRVNMQRKDFLILPIAEMTWFAQQGRFPPFCQLSQSPSNFEIFIRKFGAWGLGSGCQEMAPIQWIRAPEPLLSCLSQNLCSKPLSLVCSF